MTTPLPPGFGEAEFLQPVPMVEVVIDCQDPTQWMRVTPADTVNAQSPGSLRPDATAWGMTETISVDEWLGSFDQNGNRLDLPPDDATREPGGP